MADLSNFLMPTRPIDVETRKKVFFSISRKGARQAIVKSGGIRFYDLNFQRRTLAEYEDLRDQWETHYPDTVFQWSNTPLNTAGEDYYFDNDLTYTVNHPNYLDYKVNIRRKLGITVTTPADNVIPFQPNFAFDVDELIRVRVDDASSYERRAAGVGAKAKTYKLIFNDRTMEELLEMENFWAYHYPTRQVVFDDLVLEINGGLFTIDSNFKWQIERENSINYSFLIVEVPSDITPYTLVARSGYDTLAMSDSIAVGFSANTLSLSDLMTQTDTISLASRSSASAFTDTLNPLTDARLIGYGLLITDNIYNWVDQHEDDFAQPANLQLAFTGESLNNWSDTVIRVKGSATATLTDTYTTMTDVISIKRSANTLTLSDSANNLTDAIAQPRAGLSRSLTDTLNNWADDFTKFKAAALSLSASETINFYGESVTVSSFMTATLADNINNLSDASIIMKGQWGGFSDSINNWADAAIVPGITWTAITGATESPSGVLTKTASGGSWGNAGAVSNETRTADCRLTFYVESFTAEYFAGLDPASSCNTYATIDFGFHFNLQDGEIAIWENGVYTNINLIGVVSPVMVVIERIGTNYDYYYKTYSSTRPASNDGSRTHWRGSIVGTGSTLRVNAALELNPNGVIAASNIIFEAI